MKWKKTLKWLPSVLSIILILVFVEGGLMWSGIGAIITFHILMVAIRIYKQRKSIKLLFDMAGQLGSIHKMEAQENTDRRETTTDKVIDRPDKV